MFFESQGIDPQKLMPDDHIRNESKMARRYPVSHVNLEEPRSQGPKVLRSCDPQCFLSTTSMSQKNDGRTHRAKFGRRSLPTLNVANESQCILSGTILRSFYHSFFANRLSAKRLGMFLNLTALRLRFLRKKPKLRV